MRVRLALGGGGVRGFFHLGLLKALKEAGVEVEAVAGSSAGALAAALFAHGMPLELEPLLQALHDPELEKLAKKSRLRAGAALLKSLHRPALYPAERLEERLVRLFGNRRLEEAEIPLILTAADLKSGEPVYLREGPTARAVLASGAIPGIFPPVPWGERLLVDGDVAEKVPTGALAGQGRAPLVAVDVSNTAEKPPPQTALETLLLAGEASRKRLKNLALKEADLVLTLPEGTAIETFDFGQAPYLYELGQRAGRELPSRLPRRRVFALPWPWKAAKKR